jgi:adenylate cyclase
MDQHAAARLLELRSGTDQKIEQGLVDHEDVARVLNRVLERLVTGTAANAGFIYTYEEDARLHLHAFPSSFPITDALLKPTLAATSADAGGEGAKRFRAVLASSIVVAQAIDIAGTWFGTASLILPENASDEVIDFCETALDQTTEVLDNYLFGLYAAKQKQQTLLKLGRALRNRVLSDGLTEAARVLAKAIPLEDLALIYRAQESAEGVIRVERFHHGERLGVSETQLPHATAAKYLDADDPEALQILGLGNAQEEVLINGITRSVIVGKMVATSRVGTFNTYDRDLLANFAGFVRQRVVDFNKEWRTLAACFKPDDVAQLLSYDDYRNKFLTAREATVGILYVDIAGFTRISETLLKTPENVANLVEAWSRDVVACVWKHGGVFDKMVGDCVIGLFGPPFYEHSEGERLAAALRAALEIRDLTVAFAEREGFEVLRDSGLAVSTGVNLAPLFVGLFGPNENFTGFSSGMNNTARLQGCAKAGEILVMESAINVLPANAFAFGETGSAAVKNVAEPLRFRSLLSASA